MCGLAGVLAKPEFFQADPAGALARMSGGIAHRGPDDHGMWMDASAGIGLVHRRLAIVDLSPAGQQPMVSHSGRHILVFNGEIYNHLEIRAALTRECAAPPWRGGSDTETLLAAIEAWGLEIALERAIGMFALGLWNRDTRELALARDRFGEKPLCFGWVNGNFAFASELKALRALPGFTNPLSQSALHAYFRLLYVPAPLSIHEQIYKLPPGGLLRVQGFLKPTMLDEAFWQSVCEIPGLSYQPWWRLADLVTSARQNSFCSRDEGDAVLHSSLRQAVRRQTMADVPLGAFLSGGLDSTLVVALLQEQSVPPVHTFTIGFADAEYDESSHARAIAQALGTRHTEFLLTEHEALSSVPGIAKVYDEPFADSSQLPTFLVSREARRHVTVALSGDGGDELFGGYNRHVSAPALWAHARRVPQPLRELASRATLAIPRARWDRLASRAGVGRVMIRPGEKLHKLARAMSGVQCLDDLYDNLVSAWGRDNPVAQRTNTGSHGRRSGHTGGPTGLAGAENLMLRDSLDYLPNDILCKVDRAAMANGLETRVPFLDLDVAECAWRVPLGEKIAGGLGKLPLRRVLSHYLPNSLTERPKAGFSIPLGAWLRGPLRDWSQTLIDQQAARRETWLDSESIKAAWRVHQSGRIDLSQRLWAAIALEDWLEGLR